MSFALLKATLRFKVVPRQAFRNTSLTLDKRKTKKSAPIRHVSLISRSSFSGPDNDYYPVAQDWDHREGLTHINKIGKRAKLSATVTNVARMNHERIHTMRAVLINRTDLEGMFDYLKEAVLTDSNIMKQTRAIDRLSGLVGSQDVAYSGIDYYLTSPMI